MSQFSPDPAFIEPRTRSQIWVQRAGESPGGRIMPIANLLKSRTFDADMIAIIVTAFDAACRDLGLTDRRDPITETLAIKVIEAAQTGERDPDAIRQQAIRTLAANSPD